MPERPSENQVQGMFMISVAATLAGVHPQTLRIYEQRNLIEPHRTPKGTRLYSLANIERLQRIQQLTADGLSLAAVEKVFELETQNARLERRVAALERRLAQTEQAARAEIERIKRESRAELVLYQKPSTDITPHVTRIRIRREGETR
ncbi:MAG: MerR family transcriptional regulator [Thermoleophilaceae bacterium]|nr:MerR family transcriptional regulator [Thermoleophilaceae bacterium]